MGKWLSRVITVIALVMAIYHLVYSQTLIYASLRHENTHLAFALVLVFLLGMQRRPKLWPWFCFLIMASLAVTLYIGILYDDLEIRVGYPTIPDIYVSIILILLVLEAARQSFGYIIPIISLVFISYLFLGQYIPGPLGHMALKPARLISWIGTGFNGVYGNTAMGVSAKFLFMFILFGGVMRVSGVLPFFMEIGKLAGRRLVGGAAQTAVVSSALVGTVTGSAIANVPITGSFTIPLMKKVGYPPHEAGAIECAASAGGQIMPPIMGVSAFMMAAITLTPYWHICILAIIPALFYFFSIGVAVELRARKAGVSPSREPVDKKLIAQRGLIFIVPLAVIFWLLATGHSPMYVATWAIIATFVTPNLVGFVTKERPSVGQWVDGFSQGAIEGAKIATTVGCIGLIIAAVTTTGLGVRLSSLVGLWSHGILWVALIGTMIVSLIIGCGVPTMGAYILVAMLVAPALVRMDVPLMAAHFFCFYFAVFSTLTPPVATAALPASALAGSKYFETAVEAFKIGIVALIIPYVFVYNPAFLTTFGDPIYATVTIIGFGLAIIPLAAALSGQYMTALGWASRGMAGLIGLILFACSINAFGQAYLLFVIGAGLLFVFTLWQRASKKKAVIQ